MKKSTRFAASLIANGNTWFPKFLFITSLLVLFSSFGNSQTTTTYTQQAANYPTNLSDGGGNFNSGSYQYGQWANNGNKKSVGWRKFTTTGTTTDLTTNLRSLKIGDSVVITLSCTRAYGEIGFSLLSSPTARASWTDRLNNAAISVRLDGPSNGGWSNWKVFGSSTLTSSLGGDQTTYSNYTFSLVLTASDRMNVYINKGGTIATFYDVALNNANPITDYCVYLQDDWDGGANRNIYWGLGAVGTQHTVADSRKIYIGNTNTFTESSAITDGLASNSTSSSVSNSLIKVGSSTLTLNGTNTYTGTTAVNAGILNVNGSLAAASAVTVLSGATLSGTGTVNGTVSVNGTISPNTAGTIGTITTGNLTLGAGGTYNVDINAIPSGGTAGTNWDKLVAGTITNSATAGSNFNITLNGTIASFVSTNSYTWPIGTYTGSAPSTNNISISSTGLTNALTGVFSIAFSSGNINLIYTALPSITVGSISSLGHTCVGSTSSPQSFTISGYNLVADISVTPPSGFQISQSSGSGYTTGSITLSPTSGSVSKTIYVEFIPSSNTSYSDNITATTTGATGQNVSVNGIGDALPAITGSPFGQTVGAGAGTATYTVSATGVGLTYQWQENTGSGFGDISNGGVYNGATTATLTITNPSAGLNGYTYQCVVSGTCSPSATSGSATLTVTSNTITTGTIITSPLCAGSGVSVPFTYSPPANFTNGTCVFTAQLSPDNSFASTTNIGTVSSDESGSQSISATIPSGTTGGSTYYIRVVSTSPTGTGTSNGAALTINTLPSISASPSTATQTVCIGGSLTALNISASGGGISYEWYYNSSNSNTGGTVVSTGTGYNTASFTPSTSTASSYYYYCVISGTCSPAVTSNVSGLITVQTTSVAGTAAATTTAICTGSTGNISLTGYTGSIQWQQSLNGSTGWANVSSGGTSSSFTTSALNTSYYYHAVVTNGACSSVNSNTVLLTVNKSAAVSGTGVYTGLNDNTTGLGAWTATSVAPSGAYAGAFSAGASVLGASSWGFYSNGATGNSETVTRAFSPAMSVGNTITFSMLYGNIYAGGTEGFYIDNGSGTPLMEFYSSAGGTYKIVDGSASPVNTGIAPSNSTALTIIFAYTGSNTYTLSNGSYIYSGTFSTTGTPSDIRFFLTNGSDNFYLNNLVFNAPIITTQPSTTAQNVLVNGTANTLSVAASGANISYQWYSNSSNSNSGGTLIPGATSADYTPLTTTSGTTYYYCVVTSTCATLTSNVSGHVVVSNNPPTISGFSTANNNGITTAGYVGTVVTITGTNLTSATALTVGATSVFSHIISNTATSITFTAIPGINGIISVTVDGAVGTSSSSYVDLGYLTTGSGGNWSSSATWFGGLVPNSNNEPVTIVSGATVTLDGSYSVSSLTINAGGAFNNGTAQTLTINGGTLTKNGSFTGSTGTISFSSAGTVTGTIAFYNLTIAGGVALSNATTVNGTLLLNNGGFITGSSPIYGNNTYLNYGFTGTSGSYHNFNQSLEWPATNGPTNVTINGSYEAINLTVNRSLKGDLTVTNGTFGTSGAATLTMNGTTQNITISSASGGAISGTDNGYGNDLTLAINSGSTTTLTGDATTNGDNEKKFFSVVVNTGGKLALGCGILCKYGSFTVNGTLQINSNGYVQSGGASASYSSGNLIYNNGGGYTASDNEWPTTNSPKNVTIQNTNTAVLLNNSTTLTGTLTLNNTSLTVGSNALTFAGFTSTAGSLFTSSLSSISYTGTGAITLPSTVSTLTNLSNAGTMTIGNGIVAVSGNLTNSGILLGTVNIDGSSDQSITGNGTITNLILTGSGTTTVSSGSQSITGVLTVTSGTLNAGTAGIILKSTSITNSAIVDVVGGTINGTVTVERFIPKGLRNYRDLGPSVANAGSVFANWQESGAGSAAATYGVYITGKTGTPGYSAFDATSGFDLTTNGNTTPSLYTCISGNWAPATTATGGTKGINLNPFQGLRIVVRGSRNFNMGTNPATMPTATTLRATGNLITGTVTFNAIGSGGTVSSGYNSTYGLTPASAYVSGEGWSFIANPYACPISWSSIINNAGSTGTNVGNFYCFLDPTYQNGGLQRYVTVQYNGTAFVTNRPAGIATDAACLNIQPGQGFWVYHTAATPKFVIQEADKVAGSTKTTVFRTAKSNILNVSIWKDVNGVTTNLDETVATFDKNYTKEIGAEDVKKLMNGGENISIVESNTDLSINGIALPSVGDEIALRVGNITANTAYQLKVDANQFSAPGVQAFIKDALLNTIVPAETVVNFTATTDANTYKNRFSVVFKSAKVVPVTTVKGSISVYPNPVTEKVFTIQTAKIAVGKYKVVIVNNLGQEVFNTTINHTEGSTTETIKMNKSVSSGLYTVVLRSEEGKGVYNTELLAK